MTTATAPSTSIPESEEVNPYRWLILFGLITAAVMEVLDTTIVNVALPQMAGNLGATLEEIGWVLTGYILSNVVVLPLTAFLTETFGRRNYLTFSIILFVVASFLCGTSTSLTEIVIWRIVQGAGGAALLSTAQATIRQIFPRDQQGLVQAIFILGIIVAPTLGPTLGGWITDNYSWNWCFFINIPIGITSAFVVSSFLHDPPGKRGREGGVDFIGIILLMVGVGSLQYVLEEGNRKDWFSDGLILRLSVLSGVCLAVMLWWELSSRNKHPVVNFRVLKNRQLAASIFLFIALGFGLYGGTFIFPLFTQSILGLTPMDTGLALLPGGIATAIGAIICGKLLNGAKPLVDGRYLIAIGISIFTVAMWKLGHLSPQAGESDVRYALIFRGLALGFLFTPINNVAYGVLKPSEAQQASGLINLSRQLGGSFGIAILSTYVTTHTAIHRADLIANTYSTNPALAARQQQVVAGLVSHGIPATTALQTWYAMLEGTITRQAAMLSYNDAWIMIMLTFIVVAPAVLLLKAPTARSGPAPDMH